MLYADVAEAQPVSIETTDMAASYAGTAQSNLAKLRRTGVPKKSLTEEEVILRIGM